MVEAGQEATQETCTPNHEGLPLKIPRFLLIAALALLNESQASPTTTSQILEVQPGSAWTQVNPAPNVNCPDGNPHMDGVVDIDTPAGAGIRSEASGGTFACCEIAYAERGFALDAPRRSSGARLSFFYDTAVTGDYASTGYMLTFTLGGAAVGSRRYLGAVGANGVIGVDFDEVSPRGQVTLALDSFLGDVMFDGVIVRLSHYGCEMTATQDLSNMTLTTEEMTPAETARATIRKLEAIVSSFSPGLHFETALLQQLDACLADMERGIALDQIGEFNAARNAYKAAGNHLAAFDRLIASHQAEILAAIGPSEFNSLSMLSTLLADILFKNLQQEAGPKVDVALTFDDGPTFAAPGTPGDKTGAVLAILAATNTKATFFVEKSRILTEVGKANAKKALKAGHELGIHGVDPATHHLSWTKTTDFCAKMTEAVMELKDITATASSELKLEGKPADLKDPKYVRPPGGEATLLVNLKKEAERAKHEKRDPIVTLAQITTCLNDLVLVDFLGDGTSGANSWLTVFEQEEFKPKVKETPEQAIRRVVGVVGRKLDASKKDRSKQRVVILSHDIRDFDVANLRALIDRINALAQEKGVPLRWDTMSEMATGLPSQLLGEKGR